MARRISSILSAPSCACLHEEAAPVRCAGLLARQDSPSAADMARRSFQALRRSLQEEELEDSTTSDDRGEGAGLLADWTTPESGSSSRSLPAIDDEDDVTNASSRGQELKNMSCFSAAASDLSSLRLKDEIADKEFTEGLAHYFEGDDAQACLRLSLCLELREAVEGDIAAPYLFENDDIQRRHDRQLRHCKLVFSDMASNPRQGRQDEDDKNDTRSHESCGRKTKAQHSYDDETDSNEGTLIEGFMSPSARRLKIPSFSQRHLVDSELESELESEIEPHGTQEEDESQYSLPRGYEPLAAKSTALPDYAEAKEKVRLSRDNKNKPQPSSMAAPQSKDKKQEEDIFAILNMLPVEVAIKKKGKDQLSKANNVTAAFHNNNNNNSKKNCSLNPNSSCVSELCDSACALTVMNEELAAIEKMAGCMQQRPAQGTKQLRQQSGGVKDLHWATMKTGRRSGGARAACSFSAQKQKPAVPATMSKVTAAANAARRKGGPRRSSVYSRAA